jgi:hypothetical protein
MVNISMETTEEQQIPDKITEDYQGFIVHDGRVAGSITVGPTRLPLWAPISTMIDAGFSIAAQSWPSLSEQSSPKAIGQFAQDLLWQRKEFGRLLCVLADVERQDREARSGGGQRSLQPWYAHAENVERVRASLQSCLQHLEVIAAEDYRYIIWTDADYEKWRSTGEEPTLPVEERDEDSCE